MSTTVIYKGNTLTTVDNTTKTLKTAGKYMEDDVVLTDNSEPSFQSKSVSYTPSETAQSTTVTADSGYDGLSSVAVSVGAISSTYVGSGIDLRDSDDLTASGATVTVPVGYYSAQASKAVASGTEGIPTATKSTVSNHAISVTPSVTNSAGYIEGGTKNGLAITVSASELVSGSQTITENGTVDVTNLASIIVNIAGGGDYTRTEIVPLQTVMPDNSRTASFTATTPFVDSEYYVVTYDGTEYVTTAETLWTDNVILGDAQAVWQTTDTLYPFALITTATDSEGYFTTTSTHTVKVELLEFTGDATILSSKSITANGTYNASSDSADGYASVTVNIPSSAPSLQAKTNISPTTSSQTITADSGYDGLSSVQINAMPNGTAGTPTATKGTVSNHAISVTPSVTNTTGYITGGTKTGTAVSVSASELVSGTLSITSSGTKDVTNYASASVAAGSATAPSSINDTAATISTGTNTLTLTKSVSVTPSVTAGYISSGTAGNSSVSLTASVSTKAAATITPSTSNQTIAAGTYLTGAQTIAGDADLIASNIISTANIFGVQGSVVVQNYYTGTSEPSSSLGINGDLYFQTKE